MKNKVFHFLFVLFCLFSFSLYAEPGEKKIKRVKKEGVENRSRGTLKDRRFDKTGYSLQTKSTTPSVSAQERYDAGVKALEENRWSDAVHHFHAVSSNFPTTPLGQDAFFYLGTAYYHLEELDDANNALTAHLKGRKNSQFFEKALEYKLAIADKYRSGVRRRLFGYKAFPKWGNGKSYSLDIYEEIIVTVPSHEMAIKALYAKGHLLWEQQDYEGSVDAFRLLIKRFPKHELAPESYLAINKVFIQRAYHEFQNSDLLAFAQINLEKFKRDFPREERLEEAERDVLRLQEVYASGLYETGCFYERTGKQKASMLYYHNAMLQFPETSTAKLCEQRLAVLNPSLLAKAKEEIASVEKNS